MELYAKAGVAPPNDLMPTLVRPKTEPLIHVGDPNDIVIKVITYLMTKIYDCFVCFPCVNKFCIPVHYIFIP